MAGLIDTVGVGESDWQPGVQVMGLVAGGGYAEFTLAYADHLILIPDSLDETTDIKL